MSLSLAHRVASVTFPAMLRFRLGSIPVEVRPSHLLIAALLAYSWLGRVAANPMSAILVGGLVVFVSILVHELGHALAARAFGYQPSVVIEMLGGHTSFDPSGETPWNKDLVITLAGPTFGFALGLGALLSLQAMGVAPFAGLNVAANASLWESFVAHLAALGPGREQPLAEQALRFFAEANFAWGVLNLMPTMPLDGGRVVGALFRRTLGERGLVATWGVSLVVSAALAAFGVASGQLLIAVLFGMWAIQSVQVISAWTRARAQKTGGPQPHSADLAFVQAASLFNEQKLGEAQKVAENALHSYPAPPRASQVRLNHLLGWIAVKQGRGQAALDHFGRLDGKDVEPQALAAALALTGDEAKALPLWELAYRTQPDPSVLHEWAGTLIRLGREDDALRLKGVEPVEAFRAAERVLYHRGDFDGAARIGSQALARYPSAELAYDVACSLARAGRVSDAQAMLDRAAELGFKNSAHAASDSDLAALRQTTAFESWMRRVRDSARP